MRRMAMALGVGAAVLFVAVVSAQNKKDFTGKWAVDQEKTGGRAAGGPVSPPIVIAQDAKTLTVARTSLNGDKGITTYNLDGTETTIQSR